MITNLIDSDSYQITLTTEKDQEILNKFNDKVKNIITKLEEVAGLNDSLSKLNEAFNTTTSEAELKQYLILLILVKIMK